MDTIKAKNGFKVCKFNRMTGDLFTVLSWQFTNEECTHLRAVVDGDRLVMVACLIPYEEYLKEKEQNEMFHLCEMFTTVKGFHYIYWRDEETDTDYITRKV